MTATGHEVGANPMRKEIYSKLWEANRCTCNGLPPICRWQFVDKGFLNHFLVHIEIVTQRMGITEIELLDAISQLRKATAATRRPSISSVDNETDDDSSGMLNITTSLATHCSSNYDPADTV